MNKEKPIYSISEYVKKEDFKSKHELWSEIHKLWKHYLKPTRQQAGIYSKYPMYAYLMYL